MGGFDDNTADLDQLIFLEEEEDPSVNSISN